MIFPTSAFVHLGMAQRATRYPRLPINCSSSTISQIQRRHFIGQFLRTKEPKAPTRTVNPIPKGLGDKALIYYTGQRIVFVATLKFATVFVAGFCAFIAAPSVGVHIEYGYWAPVGIAIAGAIPFVFMQYYSPPYVTHAYLHLPPWARQSKEMVTRYSRKLPSSARISLGTIRTLGRPQLRTVILNELTYKPKRLGCANWEWKPPFENKRVYTDFYVDQRGSPAKVPFPGVVEEVIKLVKEQTQAKNQP